MKSCRFQLGKNGDSAEFILTDNDKLILNVAAKGQKYDLTFADGIFLHRKYHDSHMYKEHNFCKSFTGKSEIITEDNVIEYKTVPVDLKTGETISDLTIINRFTVCTEQPSVIQETFFVQKSGKRYDCGFFSGRVRFDKNQFDTVYCKANNAKFNLEKQREVVQAPGELILTGIGSFLKVNGGKVCCGNSSIDAHYDSLRYNDDLSCYSEENPLISVFSFEDVSIPEYVLNRAGKSSLTGEKVSVVCGRLRTEFIYNENTLAIAEGNKKHPLLAMLLRHIPTGKELFVDTLSLWECVSVSEKMGVIRFSLKNPECGQVKDIEVKITGEKAEEKDRIEWSVEVDNKSSDYSLLWCTYPRFYKETRSRCDLFVPAYGGDVEENFNVSANYTGGAYPSGFWYTMPYFALYENKKDCGEGIYFAVHDKSGALKELYAASDHNGMIKFSSRYYAENYGKAGNSNVLPGKAVWQIFDGDWFDATDIYRDFVRKECEWSEEDKSKNTPQWMQDVPFWVMDWVPYDPESGEILPTRLRNDDDIAGENDWYENPIKLQKLLETPIGYHVYNWHQIPFNNDYPHFVPARDRFLKGLEKLKENDIRVMPYINAILWDTKDRGAEDYMFEKVGRKGAVKKENGDVEVLMFESKESNGEYVKLAPMCPVSSVWKEKLLSLTAEMFEKYAIDAIYLDQIAARVPHLCMDETHGHPLGGGSWWIEGYNDILKELNAHKPQDKAFTTECNAEVYTKNINAFLSWRWNNSKVDVPAFMRIYSDKVQVFGRNINGNLKNDDMYWKYHIAQSFVFGQQMGWVNADIVRNEKRMEFVKNLVQFRYENKEFFRKFETLRPPVVEKTADNCIGDSECNNTASVFGKPYLCCGVLDDGNRKMMLIVNIHSKDVTATLRWKNEEYNFNGRDYETYGNGNISKAEEDCATVTVGKGNFMCIMWR